jgi:hypothetical protein
MTGGAKEKCACTRARTHRQREESKGTEKRQDRKRETHTEQDKENRYKEKDREKQMHTERWTQRHTDMLKEGEKC